MNLKLKIILFIVGPVLLGLSAVVFYLSYFEYKPEIRREILQRIGYQLESKAPDFTSFLKGNQDYSNFLREVQPMFLANRELKYVRLYRSQGKGWAHLYGVAVRDRIQYKYAGQVVSAERVTVLDGFRNKWVPTRGDIHSAVLAGSNRESVTNMPLARRLDVLDFMKSEEAVWREATNTLAGWIGRTEKARTETGPAFLREVPDPGPDRETEGLIRSLLARTNRYADRELQILLSFNRDDPILRQVRIEFNLTLRDHLNKTKGFLEPRTGGKEKQDIYFWRLRRMRAVKRNLTEICSLFVYINRNLLAKAQVLHQEGPDLFGLSDSSEKKGREAILPLYRVLPGAGAKALVEAGVSEDRINARLEPIVRKGLVSASLFLGLTVVVGIFLALYLIYPIHVLEKGALAIRRDRTARIRLKRKDEFGMLARVLNDLSDDLLEELKKYEALYAEATEDQLTGLMARRYFLDTLKQEAAHARRNRKPTSLLMTDIDHFKKFNDTYGHQTGDEVLAAVAGTIRKNLRRSGIRGDTAGRYGGEEFCVLLPQTGRAEAREIAERIRRSVEELRAVSKKGETLRVTISLGGFTDDLSERTPEEMIAVADKALYASKEGGRNRTTFGEKEGAGEERGGKGSTGEPRS